MSFSQQHKPALGLYEDSMVKEGVVCRTPCTLVAEVGQNKAWNYKKVVKAVS